MKRYLNPKSDLVFIRDYNATWDAISSAKSFFSYSYNMARTEGKADGKAEGEVKRTYEIARNALLKNADVSWVMDIRGLTVEAIQEIQQKIQKS